LFSVVLIFVVVVMELTRSPVGARGLCSHISLLISASIIRA
jgi:hypothetical protein